MYGYIYILRRFSLLQLHLPKIFNEKARTTEEVLKKHPLKYTKCMTRSNQSDYSTKYLFQQ